MKDILALLRKIELYTAGFLFVSATTIMFVSAFLRMARIPLAWSLDMSLFLAAWSIFLAADCALYRNRLVSVDTFVAFLPKIGQKIMQFLCYMIILVFLVVCVYNGIRLTWLTRARTFQGMPNFSYSWVTLAVPVCFSFMTLTMLGKLKDMFFPSAARREELAAAEKAKEGGAE